MSFYTYAVCRIQCFYILPYCHWLLSSKCQTIRQNDLQGSLPLASITVVMAIAIAMGHGHHHHHHHHQNHQHQQRLSSYIVFLSWLQIPLQNQGCWHPKGLRFCRASLHPYCATKSRNMGWQTPKNHPFWTFLDCILIGPWFCNGGPNVAQKVHNTLHFGKGIDFVEIRLVTS